MHCSDCVLQVVGLAFRRSEGFIIRQTPIPLSVEPGSGILLKTETTGVLGEMDSNGRKIIDVLGKAVTIQLFADFNTFRPYESKKSIGRSCDKSRISTLPSSLELFATIYGPTILFEAVGAFAAKCHLYLQHPRHCNRNVPYRNPHCLSPEEDSRMMYTFDLNATKEPFSSPSREIPANPIDLFADAAEQDTLSDAYAPQFLSTELYKHQKQALTFMMQRERGWAMDGHHRDIWTEDRDSFGRSTYQNLISGMRQMARPDQFRGGLLVDAPGLGKSLSILALILSDAESEGLNNLECASSSTTLLVVPKTCEP